MGLLFGETCAILMSGARQPEAARTETRGEEAVSRVPGRSYASSASALSPWGSHFYPALFSFLLSKMGTGREPAVGGPAGRLKKQTGAPMRSAWHDNTQCPSRLCRLCPRPLLHLSSFTLVSALQARDSHGSLRRSPEYLVPFYRQSYGGPW